jgi:hypothetical protein
MANSLRLAAVSLWGGGALALILTSLRFSAFGHGAGSFLDVVGASYEGWSILSNLLVLFGVTALHRLQADKYGRLGRAGFLIIAAAYTLPVLAQIWSGVLFPLPHPLWNIGALTVLASVSLAIVGWGLWGTASYRAASLPVWAIPVPFVIASVWMTARFFFSHFWFGVFWLGDLGLITAVNAVGFGMLGVFLWRVSNGRYSIGSDPVM